FAAAARASRGSSRMTPETQTSATALRPPAAATPPAAVEAPPASAARRRRIMILVLVVAAVAAVRVCRRVAAPATPADVIVLSGRIEADEAAVAPKVGGRILEVRMREGDAVNAGDVIAVLADEQVRAREAQASAALAQSEARAKAS